MCTELVSFGRNIWPRPLFFFFTGNSKTNPGRGRAVRQTEIQLPKDRWWRYNCWLFISSVLAAVDKPPSFISVDTIQKGLWAMVAFPVSHNGQWWVWCGSYTVLIIWSWDVCTHTHAVLHTERTEPTQCRSFLRSPTCDPSSSPFYLTSNQTSSTRANDDKG